VLFSMKVTRTAPLRDINIFQTLDILANFTRLSEKRLQQLTSLIDDSSNGFLLQNDAHDDFDDFRWCFHETEVRVLPSSQFSIPIKLSRCLMNTKSKSTNLQSHFLYCVRRGRPIKIPWFSLTKVAISLFLLIAANEYAVFRYRIRNLSVFMRPLLEF